MQYLRIFEVLRAKKNRSVVHNENIAMATRNVKMLKCVFKTKTNDVATPKLSLFICT